MEAQYEIDMKDYTEIDVIGMATVFTDVLRCFSNPLRKITNITEKQYICIYIIIKISLNHFLI